MLVAWGRYGCLCIQEFDLRIVTGARQTAASALHATAMANTRAKRAAESGEPSAATADSATTRSSKRSKKASAEALKPTEEIAPPTQALEEVPVVQPAVDDNAPLPVVKKSAVDHSAPVEEISRAVEVASDIIVDEEDEEDQNAPELAEEVRASDLYLDTVSSFSLIIGFNQFKFQDQSNASRFRL